MNGYLLDTNVLSEVLKKRPDPRLIDRVRSVAARQLLTSVICVAELRYGTARVAAGHKLWERIARDVLSLVQILSFGEPEAVRAGDLLAALDAKGVPIGIEDVFIAATALQNDLSLVTRNVRHFERIPGLRLESWWE